TPARLTGATAHRAGTYVFNDRMMLACGAATPEDCALSVYTTVVSRAAADRGILDAGSKTLTADTGALDDGFGLILEYPQAKIHVFAEEHGFLDLTRSNHRPEVGTIVRVVPNHVCVVVNLFARMIAVRGDKIGGVLRVAARGRLACPPIAAVVRPAQPPAFRSRPADRRRLSSPRRSA